MMARNEATVITMTSLCATWDISCAMTPSSSSGVSRRIRPRVTQSTACSLFRPVANAFGRSVGEIAIRGLGMSASAQIRSTMPCSSGACCGVTSWAPAVDRAILSE